MTEDSRTLKQNEKNAWTRFILGLCLGLLSLISIGYGVGSKMEILQQGVIANQREISHICKSVEALKTDGSCRSRENELAIVKLKSDIDHIKRDTAAILVKLEGLP